VADEALADLRTNAVKENVLQIAFDKPGFACAPVQESHPDVRIQEEGNSGREFTFHSPADTDLRMTIMTQSIAQGNPIAALHKKEKKLEEVFRSLTNVTLEK
jgi:hypothetical protein